MRLPSALVDAYFPLLLLQTLIVAVDGILRAIVAAPRSWTELQRAFTSTRVSPVYGLLLGGIGILPFVVALVFAFFDVPTAILQTFLAYCALGLMLLSTVAPWWGLHGLLRYYACAQGLGMTVGVCVWPILATQPYRLRFVLGSFLCYTLLFAVTAPWRHPKG